jgi:hypothetical protein
MTVSSSTGARSLKDDAGFGGAATGRNRAEMSSSSASREEGSECRIALQDRDVGLPPARSPNAILLANSVSCARRS